jgi:pimeloyl-ACP methyl ester carboxylesterase
VKAIASQPENVVLVGKGEAGIIAAYAALLSGAKVTAVTVIDPPASHRAGPILLGILKVCDIPEALGALAPTPLTLVGAKDPAFDRTTELYKLAAAPDKLIRK